MRQGKKSAGFRLLRSLTIEKISAKIERSNSEKSVESRRFCALFLFFAVFRQLSSNKDSKKYLFSGGPYESARIQSVFRNRKNFQTHAQVFCSLRAFAACKRAVQHCRSDFCRQQRAVHPGQCRNRNCISNFHYCAGVRVVLWRRLRGIPEHLSGKQPFSKRAPRNRHGHYNHVS